MSAYDKLAVCLFNFKCKALEREGEKNMMKNGVKERERCRHISGRVREGCLRCSMLVCGATDKAVHKFESGMPTSQGLGGEILAAGQVLDSGGGGGRGG